MKFIAIVTFVFFSVLSILIYFTKNYQYEKYQIDKKAQGLKEYKVNLNLARWHEFSNLPGIGDDLAQKIIQDREENGRFDKISDIMRVNGIGRKKYKNIKQYLSLDVQ